MTEPVIPEGVHKLRALIEEINKSEPELALFAHASSGKDCYIMGNVCLRCVIDELIMYCLQNQINHTDQEHPSSIVEALLNYKSKGSTH